MELAQGTIAKGNSAGKSVETNIEGKVMEEFRYFDSTCNGYDTAHTSRKDVF